MRKNLENPTFASLYNRLRDSAHRCIEEMLAESDFFELEQACAYSVGGGKLLRPVLALATAEAVELPITAVRSFACALELIHSFSLVHDDLPIMDNDALRRGKPTTHIRFGAAPALLVGDALLARTFGLIAEDRALQPEAAVRLCALLARTTIDLCRGQLLDLEAAGQERAEDYSALVKRHSLKTGALIVAAVLGPLELLSANKRAEWSAPLQSYGQELGLLFQITDDILDETASEETLGKPIGADRRQGTPTFVSLFGLEHARRLAGETAGRAKAALQTTSARDSFLTALAEEILHRSR